MKSSSFPFVVFGPDLCAQRAHRLLGSCFGFAFQVRIEIFMKFQAESRVITEVSRTPLAQSEQMKQNGAEKHPHGSRTGRRKRIEF